MAVTLVSIRSRRRSRPVCDQSERSDGSMTVALPVSYRPRGYCRQNVRTGRASSVVVAWVHRSNLRLRIFPLVLDLCYRGVAALTNVVWHANGEHRRNVLHPRSAVRLATGVGRSHRHSLGWETVRKCQMISCTSRNSLARC